MTAIFKRELRAYFTSPVGYIYLGVTLFVSGLMFAMLNLSYFMTDMSYYFGNMTVIFFYTAPFITMRLFTEEKRGKTDQLLLTSPVTVTRIVLGKYLSAVTLFAITLGVTFVYPAILWLYGDPMLPSVLALYIGFFLTGSALISIGVFVSSTTESQIIAAIVSFVAMFFIQMMGSLGNILKYPLFKTVIDWLSIMRRYEEFTTGILSLSSIVYLISFAAVFLFLTVLNIEKKRWS